MIIIKIVTSSVYKKYILVLNCKIEIRIYFFVQYIYTCNLNDNYYDNDINTDNIKENDKPSLVDYLSIYIERVGRQR